MPLITALVHVGKRQAVSIVAGPACYSVCNNAAGVFQSVGFDSKLCDVPGDFALAMLAVYSCTSKHSSDSGSVTQAFPYLYTPLSYCEAKYGFLESLTAYEATVSADLVADSISSLQASLESATSSYCSLVAAGSLKSVPEYITCSQTTTGLTSAASTAAAASSLPSSTLSASTSTTTSSTATSTAASDSGLSKGAIAGVAVGATIAGILIIALVIGFIWWYRRKRRRDQAATNERDRLQNTPEKAQLHSDEYKPRREELQGSKAPQRIRAIEGLHEIESQDLSRVRSEMSVNEVAATELDRLGSSHMGTDSTLIDSSERTHGR